jgi:hypothetical protein
MTNLSDNNGWTTLSYACAHSLNNKYTSIAHRDTDPNSVDNDGISVLEKVIHNDDKDTISSCREEIKSLLYAAGAR